MIRGFVHRPVRPTLRSLLCGGAAVLLLAAACQEVTGQQQAGRGFMAFAPADDRRLADAASDPANWLTHGGTYAEQRYSALDQITADNVAGLKLAWFADFDTSRGQEATPLVVDGVLYTTTAWSKLFAYDAATGRQLWGYDPEVPGVKAYNACCDVVNRGAAYYGGRIYFGTIDGRLIAVDAKTGKPVWSTQTVDPGQPYSITGAPRIVKGKVLIGNGGAEYGVRGYVTAYDAATGAKVWRFYTVPNATGASDGEASDEVLKGKAAGTWFGDAWKKTGGGGTVWDAIVYDPKYSQVYIGVGNGTPWNHKVRSDGKGDNLFLSSIVALDADTGRYVWHYQTTPGESWDFTATQPIIQATLTIDGQPRDVLMQAPKNGFFYVIDRKSGRLLSGRNYVPANWASGIDAQGRPIENPEARKMTGALQFPGALGGHNWHPMSFSPKTGLVYIPAQELGFPYVADETYSHRQGRMNTGVDWTKMIGPDDRRERAKELAKLKGWLLAWDPVAQKEVWRFEHGEPWNGGTLATAGNLVFQGTAAGSFNAYSADKGKLLWRFDAQNSMMGGPISFAVKGQQYVAVLAGAGGAYNLSIDTPGRVRAANGRLLVFKLGGKAALPRLAAPVLAPANPSADRFTSHQVAEGRRIYAETCDLCHGEGANSSGVLPDLRRSGALADRTIWNSILLEGALEPRGMINFSKFLKPDEVEALRAYVSHQADLLKQAEGPSQ